MQTTQDQSSQFEKAPHTSLPLEIDRVFDAPVSLVFAAFKTSEAIKAWWWPNGLYADRVDFDFRENGRYFINMKGAPRGGGGMTGHFEKIIDNEQIVMTDKFADVNGNAISAKQADMPGDWPDTIYITFDFENLGENRSRFHLSQSGIPNDQHKDCIQGWSESFDKLENYLRGAAGGNQHLT